MPSPLVVTGFTLTALGMAVALWAEGQGRDRVLVPFKTLASAGFLAAALGYGALESRYGATVFVGLVLCLVGDVLLALPGKGAFRAGILSFLLGHVAYVVAFVGAGLDTTWAAGAAAGAALVAWPVMRWLWPHVTADFKAPVSAYVLVISVMVIGALGAAGGGATPLIAAGALAFYVSDLAVARQRFVTEDFRNRLVGLPLYYGAQLVIAATVAAI